MFQKLCTLFSSLAGDCWTQNRIRLSTNGTKNMVGKTSGTFPRFQGVLSLVSYRMWCWAHQLEWVMQSVFVSHVKNGFQDSLHRLIYFLGRTINFIAQMDRPFPIVESTRCLSLNIVKKWLVENSAALIGYLYVNNAAKSPHAQRWVQLHVAQKIITVLNF